MFRTEGHRAQRSKNIQSFIMIALEAGQYAYSHEKWTF